ncbi:MAG: hypothetical protein V1929_08340 [bacterium]
MKKALRQLSYLFTLTREEQYFLAGVLAIAIVGIAARYWHLKHETPETYQPEGVALTEEVRSE